MSELIIRKAVPADAPCLKELYENHLTQCALEDETSLTQWYPLLTSFSKDECYHLLVGEVDEGVVSSVTLVVIPNLTHGIKPYAIIENVVTHKNFRNRGYAGALLHHACKIAEEMGCYKVMLMTGSKKESTLQFYEKCGFDPKVKTAFYKKL